MIAIKDRKMPVNCEECFARVMAWCRLDEEERMVVPALPDELPEGRPDWCPLIDIPDMNVGKCSEIPNNSDCVSRQDAVEVADAIWTVTGDKNVAKVWQQLKDLPSAQPEIIRCKDCKYYETMYCKMDVWTDDMRIYKAKPNDFCSYAERKTDG